MSTYLTGGIHTHIRARTHAHTHTHCTRIHTHTRALTERERERERGGERMALQMNKTESEQTRRAHWLSAIFQDLRKDHKTG